MERKEGYYWVKVKKVFGVGYATDTVDKPVWIVRHYTPPDEENQELEYWRDGAEDLYNENDMLEIDETPIVRNDN